jgi:hypothetical protein
VEFEQVVIGSYSVWLHADGYTWQKNEKPGDVVDFSFRVNPYLYGGEINPELVSASIFDFTSGEYRSANKLETSDQKYSVNDLEEIAFKKTSRGDFQIKTKVKLITALVEGHNDENSCKTGFGGKDEKQDWQLKEVRGFKFYIPVKLKFKCTNTIKINIEESETEPIQIPEIDKEEEVVNEIIDEVKDKDEIKAYDFNLIGPRETYINQTSRFSIETDLPRATLTYNVSPAENVMGNITYDGGYLTFSKGGTYNVTANLLGRRDVEVIEVIDPRPSAVISHGKIKQNLFSEIDGSLSRDNYSSYPIDWEKTVWEIHPKEGININDLEITEENIRLDNHIRINKLKKINIKSGKVGKVNIKLKVVNSIGRTHVKSKVISVREDELPVPSLYTEPTSIRSKIKDGVATACVSIYDTSISPDLDGIKFRKYIRVFDSNNDGSFQEENYEFYDGKRFIKSELLYSKNKNINQASLDGIFTTEKKQIEDEIKSVGKYLYDVYVSESEYSPFVGASKYQNENTRTCEVINIAPSTHFKVSSSKNINVVILTDGNSEELKNVIDDFKKKEIEYGKKGVSAKINIVNDNGEVVLEKNNKVEKLEKWTKARVKEYIRYVNLMYKSKSYYHGISMYGVDRSKFSDFYDAGFIYRRGIMRKDRKNYIESYRAVYEKKEMTDGEVPEFEKSSRVSFVKIGNKVDSRGGKAILTKYFPSDDPGDFKKKSIITYEPYQGGVVSRTKVELLGAEVDSSWTIKDVEKNVAKTVNSVDYSKAFELMSKENNDKDILIFYSKNGSDAFDLEFGNYYPFANAFSKGYAKELFSDIEVFMSVPSHSLDVKIKDDKKEKLKIESSSLREMASYSVKGVSGIYDETQLNEIFDRIYEEVPEKKDIELENGDVYVVRGGEVFYKNYYSDFENDDKYSEKWTYKHDPIFESNKLLSDISNDLAGELSEKVRRFDKTGVYTVTNKVTDNPATDSRFLNYSKISKESEPKKIIVHERPIAYFKSVVSLVGEDLKFDVFLKEGRMSSFDPDVKSKGLMGLKSVSWFYMDSHGVEKDITEEYGLSSSVKEKYEVSIPSIIMSSKFELGLKVVDEFDCESLPYRENPYDVLNVDFSLDKEVNMGEDLVIRNITSQSSKKHDLHINIYDGESVIYEKTLKSEESFNINDINRSWRNQSFKVPHWDYEKNIRVQITILENGGRNKSKSKYIDALPILKLESFSINGSWNHWKGGVDKLGNELSVEPNRFMSYEKITIRAKFNGPVTNAEIDFDDNLKKMIFTDREGHEYRYADEVGEAIKFPIKLKNTKDNVYEASYIIPLAESTKSWDGKRLKSPYEVKLTVEKGRVIKIYRSREHEIIPYIEITGNIHDLIYIQPLR